MSIKVNQKLMLYPMPSQQKKECLNPENDISPFYSIKTHLHLSIDNTFFEERNKNSEKVSCLKEVPFNTS